MFQPLLEVGTRAQINILYQTHRHLNKKQYFDKTTNHNKDLDFLEDFEVFNIEVIPNLPNHYIKYEYYNDAETTTGGKGLIQSNTLSKNIVITNAYNTNSTYFLLIQIYTENNELIETIYRFISRERILKKEEEKKRIHDANKKYLEENRSNLEEIIEYTTMTHATSTVITGADIISSIFNNHFQQLAD